MWYLTNSIILLKWKNESTQSNNSEIWNDQRQTKFGEPPFNWQQHGRDAEEIEWLVVLTGNASHQFNNMQQHSRHAPADAREKLNFHSRWHTLHRHSLQRCMLFFDGFNKEDSLHLYKYPKSVLCIVGLCMKFMAYFETYNFKISSKALSFHCQQLSIWIQCISQDQIWGFLCLQKSNLLG